MIEFIDTLGGAVAQAVGRCFQTRRCPAAAFFSANGGALSQEVPTVK
jgi:hypothetical protein